MDILHIELPRSDSDRLQFQAELYTDVGLCGSPRSIQKLHKLLDELGLTYDQAVALIRKQADRG